MKTGMEHALVRQMKMKEFEQTHLKLVRRFANTPNLFEALRRTSQFRGVKRQFCSQNKMDNGYLHIMYCSNCIFPLLKVAYTLPSLNHT